MSILSGFQNLTISSSTFNIISGNRITTKNAISDSENHHVATTAAPSACISSVPMVPGKTALPRLSDMFTGREDILHLMAQYLGPKMISDASMKQRIFVLHGLGGAGKSQIMAKFVDEFGNQFFCVYYIDASTPETIQASFEDIARTTSAGNTVDDALNWLVQERKNWLLLIDNADDPKVNLCPFLPPCRHGNVIITTRNPDCRRYGPDSNCNVSGMKHDDAIELLLKSAMVEHSAKNRSLAASICDELGYLALAIAQAGTYIQQCCSISEYLQIYHKDRSKLLQRHSVQTTDNYKWTVYTTWEMSLKKLSWAAAEFLRLCAFMHRDGISKAIFQNAATAGDLRDVFRDGNHFLSNFKSENGQWIHSKFIDHTKELASYSLISIDTENQIYSIHPLVHTWLRCRESPARQWEAQNSVLQILALAVNDDYSAEAYAFRRSLLPHIDESRTDEMNYEIADKFQKVYFEAQRLSIAEEMQRLVMEARRTLLGDEHLETLTSMSNLTRTYVYQGRWKESEELDLQIVAARKRFLGVDHPDTLKSMTNLACTYRKQGRWKEAEELGLQVMNTSTGLLGFDHPDALESMASLASTYWYQGRFKETEELVIQVTLARRRLLGIDHPDTLTSMANLGYTYESQGRLKEAEEFGLEVMEARRRLLGIDHPDTLKSMSSLACTYQSQGRLKEAEELDRKVMEARKRLLGDDHPDTLTSMARLACTYENQGRSKEAEELNLQTMEARKILLGVDHPDTLWSMGSLACTYGNQGRLKEAEELELQVMEVMRRWLGVDHQGTLKSMASLARTYDKQGRFKEAEGLELHVMEAMKRWLGDGHPDTLKSMINLACTYKDQGRLEEAEKLGLQTMETGRRLLGDDHPITLKSISNLADTYRKQWRLTEAEKFGLLATEARKRLLGVNHPNTLKCMANLACTYWSQGRFNEARDLELQVKEARKRSIAKPLVTPGNLQEGQNER